MTMTQTETQTVYQIREAIKSAAERHCIKPSQVHSSRKIGARARHEAMTRLRNEGIDVATIACAFGMDVSTVYSITKEQ